MRRAHLSLQLTPPLSSSLSPQDVPTLSQRLCHLLQHWCVGGSEKEREWAQGKHTHASLLPLDRPTSRHTLPPSPLSLLHSGPPALLLTYRLVVLTLSLIITVPTLVPALREAAPMADAYRYAADLRGSAAFYSTWTWFLALAFFGCASVASAKRLHAARSGRRGGGGESAAAVSAAAAATADGTAAATAAAALLHAAAPAAAFVSFTTFWVVLPAASTQEAWWEVVATIATPLGLAAAGGGLAALVLDTALSRVHAPRPLWLLLTTAWPAAFLAGGAVVALVKSGQGGGGGGGAPGVALGDPALAAATAPAAASGSAPPPAAEAAAAAAASSLWTAAAAYSMGATLLAHLVAAVGLGIVVAVREGLCAAGAAVARRAKRA